MNRYNLWDEEWVLVIDNENKVQKVSLTELILHADKYKRLAGETALQDLAVQRVVQAIILSAYYKAGKCTWEDWLETWENKEFDKELILKYKQDWYDRFYLISDEYPFMQFTDTKEQCQYLTKTKDFIEKDFRHFIAEVSESDNKLMPYKTWESCTLSLAEATRYLIQYQAIATKNMTAPKDVAPAVCGTLGMFQLITLECPNFFETLMICTPFDIGEDKKMAEPKPLWENPTRFPHDKRIVPLTDLGMLWTYPSKRCRLQIEEDDNVKTIQIFGNHSFAPKVKGTKDKEDAQDWSGYNNLEYLCVRNKDKPMQRPVSTSKTTYTWTTNIVYLWQLYNLDSEVLSSWVMRKGNYTWGYEEWLKFLEDEEIDTQYCLRFIELHTGQTSEWGTMVKAYTTSTLAIDHNFLTDVNKRTEMQTILTEIGSCASSYGIARRRVEQIRTRYAMNNVAEKYENRYSKEFFDEMEPVITGYAQGEYEKIEDVYKAIRKQMSIIKNNLESLYCVGKVKEKQGEYNFTSVLAILMKDWKGAKHIYGV